MPSALEICNLALQNLGANRISSVFPSDASPEADECNLRYDAVRRAVLESCLWTFASTRTALNLLEVSPIFGYTNQFALPSDYIRMVASEEQESYVTFPPSFNGYITISNSSQFYKADNYKIERANIGGTWYSVLLSNDGAKNIIYIYDNDDESTYPPAFVEMLAQGLSAAICYRVTNNQAKTDTEYQKFQAMLDNASTMNSQNGVHSAIYSSAFIGVRQ
jgi:hypothetical protein